MIEWIRLHLVLERERGTGFDKKGKKTHGVEERSYTRGATQHEYRGAGKRISEKTTGFSGTDSVGLETMSTMRELVDDQTWKISTAPVGIWRTGRDMGATASMLWV
jgi:hypothetical protein